jgi:hypothetical protein
MENKISDKELLAEAIRLQEAFEKDGTFWPIEDCIDAIKERQETN